MIAKEDTYKDVARIPWRHRLDKHGTSIQEGRICKVSVNGRSKLLSLRGMIKTNEEVVFIDGATRDVLGVKVSTNYDFKFKEVRLWGQFLWAWRASDPIYRIAAQLGLISVILGIAGLLLGLIGVYLAVKN